MTQQKYLLAKVFVVEDEDGNESVDVEYMEPLTPRVEELMCKAWSLTHGREIQEYCKRIKEAKRGTQESE